jgi:hypothetical protein
MRMKPSLLLVIPLLSILSEGCATDFSTTSQNPWPIFPAFTQDSSPDPPNYYWMTDSQFTHDDSDDALYVQQKSRKGEVSSPGNVIVQPATSR